MSEAPKLKIVGQDSRGELLDAESINRVVAYALVNQNESARRSKIMGENIEQATQICEDTMKVFNHSLNRLVGIEKEIAEQSKKVSGQVRKSANELGEGLQRIEKVADLNKLEKYVSLLERIANAMTVLAELEKNGKLEKIAAAIK